MSTKKSTCAICLNTVKHNNKYHFHKNYKKQPVQTTCCRQHFHEKCLLKACKSTNQNLVTRLNKTKKCPLCRNPTVNLAFQHRILKELEQLKVTKHSFFESVNMLLNVDENLVVTLTQLIRSNNFRCKSKYLKRSKQKYPTPDAYDVMTWLLFYRDKRNDTNVTKTVLNHFKQFIIQSSIVYTRLYYNIYYHNYFENSQTNRQIFSKALRSVLDYKTTTNTNIQRWERFLSMTNTFGFYRYIHGIFEDFSIYKNDMSDMRYMNKLAKHMYKIHQTIYNKID